MKAIVYTSNTGFTARYAHLLGESVNLPVYSLAEANRILNKGDEIIFLGWLFAGNIKGYRKSAKKFRVSLVCGVGLGDTGSQIDTIRKTAKIEKTIPLFTLQGGMDHSKLHGINRFMIRMLIKMLEKKERTPDEERMLLLIKKGGDYVSRKNLEDVLCWIKDHL